MLCKCHWIVLYTVYFTAFCLGGPFFSQTRCIFKDSVCKVREQSQMILLHNTTAKPQTICCSLIIPGRIWTCWWPSAYSGNFPLARSLNASIWAHISTSTYDEKTTTIHAYIHWQVANKLEHHYSAVSLYCVYCKFGKHDLVIDI